MNDQFLEAMWDQYLEQVEDHLDGPVIESRSAYLTGVAVGAKMVYGSLMTAKFAPNIKYTVSEICDLVRDKAQEVGGD